jgi:pimeloyl-ACP methyl ester carboxylesterase
MALIFCSLIAALAVLLLPLLHYRFWCRYFSIPYTPDEVHTVRCSDGWKIALYRRLPRGGTHRAADPVILCHGLGANRHDLDFTEDRSLALYLRERGYDVWVLELRGRGGSARRRREGPPYDYDVTDFVEKDVPAAIERVLSVTGARRVNWIGHSLGGIVIYALFSKGLTAGRVKTLVTLGSPGRLIPLPHLRVIALITGVLRFLPAVYQIVPARFFAPLLGYWNPRSLLIMIEPENLSGPMIRRALVNVVANVSRRVQLQFNDWVLGGPPSRREGLYALLEHMERINIPCLFIAGTKDRIVRPEAVRVAYRAVSSRDRTFLVFGRSEGHRRDYGHGDLGIGDHVADEVFPAIEAWLRERA